MCKLPKSIKMVITDFDGIITDNCVYIDSNKNISRKLNFKDIMAFSLLSKNGYKIGIISGEANSAIELVKEIRNRKDKEIAEVKKYSKERMDAYKDNAARILKKVEIIFGRPIKLSEITEDQTDLFYLALLDMRDMKK